MSNEIANTGNSPSESTPGTEYEGKKEFITTINSTVKNAEDQTGFNNKGIEDEGESDCEWAISDKAFVKEERAKETARREKLDYEQALKEKMEWDGTYHPGVDGNDLVQFNGNHLVVSQDWFDNDESLIYSYFDTRRFEELCHNCGWNSRHQISPWGYTSRLKVRHLKGEAVLWEAGPKWFVRDEINNDWNGCANDYKAQQLVHSNFPEVPLVEMHRFGEKEDKYALTVMSRAKGTEFANIEDQLTPEQKDILAKDLASYIHKWRKLTAPRIQTADGEPLRDFIFRCDHGPCQDVPFNTIEWLEKLVPAWRKTLFRMKYNPLDNPPKGRFPESWIREVDEKIAKVKTVLLKEGGLSNEEYVFTHGDLHGQNIFVFEEIPGIYKISAILDWEFAGYCPWWVEWYYGRRTGLFFGKLELLMSSENITAFSKIEDEMGKLMSAFQEQGEQLFKHSPNDQNCWHGRPFSKCAPFCASYRSDDSFALKPSREVTYDVTENYPDHLIEFDKMWNNLVQSEGQPNSLTKQYTDGEII